MLKAALQNKEEKEVIRKLLERGRITGLLSYEEIADSLEKYQ